MKIALIGVTGRVGSRLLAELLRRGHHVTGIARNTGKLPGQPGLVLTNADADQPAQLAPLLAGHDAVISALKFATTDAAALITAVKQARVKRLMVVGGAATLEVAPGHILLDAPGFPAAYRPEAEGGLRSSTPCAASANWTGPSCRRQPSSTPASAPASSASAPTSCSPMRTARAGFLWRTTRSPSSTNWRRRGIRGNVSPWVTE
jgi:hypothetical protein